MKYIAFLFLLSMSCTTEIINPQVQVSKLQSYKLTAVNKQKFTAQVKAGVNGFDAQQAYTVYDSYDMSNNFKLVGSEQFWIEVVADQPLQITIAGTTYQLPNSLTFKYK